MKIVVAGPDGAALDRYEARFGELAPLLGAQVTEVMRAFVKQHTGVEFRAPSATVGETNMMRLSELRISLELPSDWSVHSSQVRGATYVVLLVPTDEVERAPGEFTRGLDVTREPATAREGLGDRVEAEIRKRIGKGEPFERADVNVGGRCGVRFSWTDGIHDLSTWIVDAPDRTWLIANALVLTRMTPVPPTAHLIGEPIVRGIVFDDHGAPR